ncbi:hypothetical protein BTHE_1930 [Bifidobacterium thermophilum]|nr:hypothetical protein BTHE_1930 [Bifidobacterium thermophilum]
MSPAAVRVIQGALGDGVVVEAAACRLPRAVATSVCGWAGRGICPWVVPPHVLMAVCRVVSFSSVRMRRTIACEPVAVLQILAFLMLIVSGDSQRRGYPRASGRLGTYCVAGCE